MAAGWVAASTQRMGPPQRGEVSTSARNMCRSSHPHLDLVGFGMSEASQSKAELGRQLTLYWPTPCRCALRPATSYRRPYSKMLLRSSLAPTVGTKSRPKRSAHRRHFAWAN